MITTTNVAAELVAAWDAWEAHPYAATPLFRRQDALTAAAITVTTDQDRLVVDVVASSISDRIRVLRGRRMPTSDAVRQVLTDMGGGAGP